MTLVVDASMAVAWVFKAERTPIVRDILRRVTEEGAIVPAIWRLEVANALRSAVRRKRCDAPYAERSIARFSRLPVAADMETDRHAWKETLELSRRYGLTPYDASYLELAIRLRHPLASCDRDLIRAATTSGLTVLAGA